MKHLLEADPAAIERLSERLKRTRDLHAYQRIQCVLMRLTLKCSAAEIALVLGWAPTTVHTIHSRWARDGDAVFDLRQKGGRRNQNMTADDEAQLLAPFLQQSGCPSEVSIEAVHRAYEAHLGRAVALSTIYRLLHRHGWHKPVVTKQAIKRVAAKRRGV